MLKKRAIGEAIHIFDRYAGRLTNHLCGRLEGMLRESATWQDWCTKYLQHLENREAGKTLKDIGLWEPLNTSLEKDISDAVKKLNDVLLIRPETAFNITGEEMFGYSTTYWMLFFRTIRKLNQQQNITTSANR